MLHKLKADRHVQCSNRRHRAFICSCLKPLVLSTLFITLLSTSRVELELHLFLSLQTCLIHLRMSELCFQEVVRINSVSYNQVLIFQLRIVRKLFSNTHGSCLCVGKNEAALLYSGLKIFRLSGSVWTTKEQNQYQDSLWVESLM
jgi:hypothetical protein